MSQQLSLAAVDAAAPKGDPDASQWFTPADLAKRIVEWAGVAHGEARVLEPSAGIGRFVWPLIEAGAFVTVVERDERMMHTMLLEAQRRRLTNRVIEPKRADFLALAPEPHDLAIMNPPYENGAAEAHVMRALEWAPRVVALVPLAFLCCLNRYEVVWRHVRLMRQVNFIRRPSFGGDQGGSRDFGVFDIVRRTTPRTPEEADRVEVKWWEP